ncbi:MAG TPA: hypothetical protein PLZ79_10325 [Burkholderiales bacterium]|nr:hypothetical protein [Burkholderiales bacterium]
MATDLDQLIQKFYDYFVDRYRKSGAPGADVSPAFLAFESIGTAVTADMFQLGTGDFSPQLALEQFSTLANVLPVLDGTTITNPSLKTADGLYELMLFSAKLLPAADAGPFDHFRNKAAQALDTSTMVNLLPTGRPFHPAVATPPDWCAPVNAGGWTSASFSHSEQSTTEVGVGDPPPPVRPLRPWNIRVLAAELRPALESPMAVTRVMPQLRARMLQADVASPQTVSGPRAAAFAARSNKLAAFAAGEAQTAESPQQDVALRLQALAQQPAQVSFEPPPPAAARTTLAPLALRRFDPDATAQIDMASKRRTVLVMRPEVLAAQTMALNAAAANREVTSSSISLSFDYCLVNVTRPWLATEFLSLKNWYMEGFRDGELASGSGGGGMPLEIMPVAALVVRKLSIKAAWSHDDQVSLQDTLSFGPFSLQGRVVDQASGEITCPDMQIVAWICEPMPRLPPAADPALVAAAPAPAPAPEPAPEPAAQTIPA